MTSPTPGVPWKKILLIGGLLLVLLLGCGVGAVALIFRSLRSSGAYTQAMARAQADPRVLQALGAPVREDWYLLGSVNLVNDGGHADLLIPLRGKEHSGRLHVVADRAAGVWTLTILDLETTTRKRGAEELDYNTLHLLP